MPWGRVDDTFHSHPKVTSIPAEIRMAAVGLHWMAISWCNAHTTDGKVPAHVIAALGGNDEQATALVTARLWHRAGRCYRIHDFLDFNTSKAVLAERHLHKTEAGRAGAQARWQRDSRAIAPATPLLDGSDSRAIARAGASRPVPSRPISLDVSAAGTGETRPRDGTWFDPAPRPGVEKAGDTLARVVGRRAGSGGSDSR